MMKVMWSGEGQDNAAGEMKSWHHILRNLSLSIRTFKIEVIEHIGSSGCSPAAPDRQAITNMETLQVSATQRGGQRRDTTVQAPAMTTQRRLMALVNTQRCVQG